jgi:DNA-binding MarR family transcriptional regulator
MADLIEKQQLASEIFEFTSLQHLADEQAERHSPVFRGQNKILVALAQEDGVSQKELTDRLGMTAQSTAEFITKLVKKGFITKTKSESDGRVQLITLTEKGRKEAEKNLFYIPEYIDYLEPKEWGQLSALLEKMNQGIRENLNVKGIQNLGTKILLNQIDRKTSEDENNS